MAADYGHDALVAFLLPITDDPYTEDNCGRTPIHLAALKGYQNIVRMLMENYAQNSPNFNGKNFDTQDFSGETPLFIGKISNKLSIVTIFVH